MINKISDFVGKAVDFHDLENDSRGLGIVLEVTSEAVLFRVDADSGKSRLRPLSKVAFDEHL